MQMIERVSKGGNVESAQRDRRNLVARGAQRARNKITRPHLSTSTPDALEFASASVAIMEVSINEGKSANAEKPVIETQHGRPPETGTGIPAAKP